MGRGLKAQKVGGLHAPCWGFIVIKYLLCEKENRDLIIMLISLESRNLWLGGFPRFGLKIKGYLKSCMIYHIEKYGYMPIMEKSELVFMERRWKIEEFWFCSLLSSSLWIPIHSFFLNVVLCPCSCRLCFKPEVTEAEYLLWKLYVSAVSLHFFLSFPAAVCFLFIQSISSPNFFLCVPVSKDMETSSFGSRYITCERWKHLYYMLCLGTKYSRQLIKD